MNKAESSSSTQQEVFRSSDIWNAPCTATAKQFLWRIAHNSLPTMLGIQRRGIEVDALCPVCTRLDEYGAHLFIKCKEVRKVWSGLQMEHERQLLTKCAGPKEFVQLLLSWDNQKVMMSIALLWTWWRTRNKVNAEQKNLNINEVLFQVRREAADYEMFCLKAPNVKVGLQHRWKLPDGDTLKINADHSFQTASRNEGYGFVIPDKEGEAVCAGAGRLNFLQDSLQAEAEACVQALHAAQGWGMTGIILETYSRELVQAITTCDYDLSTNRVLFREIKALARLNFSSFCAM